MMIEPISGSRSGVRNVVTTIEREMVLGNNFTDFQAISQPRDETVGIAEHHTNGCWAKRDKEG